MGEPHDTANLRAELARLRGANPFQVLGLPVTASNEDVRGAFLDATKRWHPNRFALLGADTRELATELFLVVRAAYEQLSTDERRKGWSERLAPPVHARAATVPAGPPPEASKPPTKPPAGAPPATAATPPAPPVVQPRAPTPVPPGKRPVTAQHPARTTAEVQSMLESAKTRSKRFEDAQTFLVQGRYHEAREALFQIAAEDPSSKKYRVQLHLAWGLEHKAAGRPDDAVRELERALALDPSCSDAADAIRKISAERKGGGIFSKLFGR